jgi:prepilin-type N-terminal cleavage/methylation domain-containing protein
MRKKNNRGFSLVEILFVTLILSIISLAIFTTFSNGIKIWNRINKKTTQEDLVIFCDRFGTDLRSSFKFKGIDFIGQKDRLEFASLVNSQRLNPRTVGRIIYAYEPNSKTLSRFQNDYSSVYSEEQSLPKQSFKNIKSVKFEYYFYDNVSKEYLWLEDWSKDGLPQAVRMEMDFDTADMQVKLTRTFGISVNVQK